MNIAVGLGQWTKQQKPKWTDEKVEALKALALDGLTAKQIGEIIGFNKNQVIGKCHRVGVHLLSRSVYEVRLGNPATALKRQARHATPGDASSKSGARPGITLAPTATQRTNDTLADLFPFPTNALVSSNQPSVNPPRYLTLAQLEPTSCRFPLGDPCHESFRFCGAVRKGSLPYCAECAERAYIIPPPPKPRSWRRP